MYNYSVAWRNVRKYHEYDMSLNRNNQSENLEENKFLDLNKHLGTLLVT